MTEAEIKERVVEMADKIANAISKGQDIMITKAPTDIVVKKMTVQKV